MAKSSMKIVLVDPLGDILFSGDSLIGSALADGEESKTSATVSGIYPRVTLGVVETDCEKDDAETAPAPSRTRAA